MARQIYDTVANGSESAGLQSLGRAFAKDYPTYKKGYRSLQNFLRKSGLFEIAGNDVRLK
ncbi:MAG: hypothetical protein HC855_13425 [Rhizobiales bacterium]|nr:hypothetical protein [Hyphomicrobiales bacterium]